MKSSIVPGTVALFVSFKEYVLVAVLPPKMFSSEGDADLFTVSPLLVAGRGGILERLLMDVCLYCPPLVIYEIKRTSVDVEVVPVTRNVYVTVYVVLLLLANSDDK